MPQEAASGLWRSEDMVKLTLVMQREAVHESLYCLGRDGICQFEDMQKGVTAFQRPYTNEIRRCDDLERRLRYFHEQMAQHQIKPKKQTHETSIRKGALDALETTLEHNEKEVRELNGTLDNLKTELNRCREFKEVLSRNIFADTAYNSPAVLNRDSVGPNAASPSTSGLLTVAGVVPDTKVDTMNRLVYRVSRGNCFMRTDAVAEPFEENDLTVKKSVFIVYGSSQRVMDRVKKLADSMGATTYTMSNDLAVQEKLDHQMLTLETTLEKTTQRLVAQLMRLAATYESSMRTTQAEKGIYAAMNLIEYSGTLAKATVWVPSADRETLQEALAQGASRAGADVQSVVEECEVDASETYPTFFRTNIMTEVFQGIVDSYGIARYKEVNPGVLTIITFPYLFGVMYGDIGHGVLLTLFAAFLIVFERKFLASEQHEIFAMIFGGRYLLFLMGLFAIYVGILYNDFFGFSLGLFKSAYTWPVLPPDGPKGVVSPTSPNGHPNVAPETPYAFGIDVAWTETENKLEFYNSTKMKCAVIIGVIQMTVGLFFSLMNHLHRKDYKKVWFGFIPEVIFLTCTFGYMSILIIVKWCTKWENTHEAPSLLETMTNFFLAPGTVPVPLYSGQAAVQVVLLLVAFAMVPVMLLVIPLMEKRKHQRAHHTEAHHNSERRPLSPDQLEAAEADILADFAQFSAPDDFDFSEVMIHYIIHTIEFVLGCVSNTASYLRLWALSLAHAQLSEVFLNFGLLNAMSADSGSGVVLMIGFAVWLGATCMVLLMMESLSAFLHALRLHWVEFQNKFYAGDGKAFTPFTIRDALNVGV